MFRFFLLAMLIVGLIIAGCSGGGSPVDPATNSSPRVIESSDSHTLWGLYDMHVSDDHSEIIIVPRRIGSMHLNARTFLEDGPCFDCLSIGKIKINPGWVMDVTIILRHPFLGQNIYTGFDVRGIAMFNGSLIWPGSGLVMSDADSGDIELLNPDGYTRLFNPIEYAPGTGAGPIHEYSHGKLAPPGDPNTTLNGYIDFYTNEERRYFLPGQTVNRTYQIQAKPGGFSFGYAIDASWQMPTGTPPFQVPDDFPLSANCAEAYELSFTYEPGMKADGTGISFLTVDVYDWQDPSGVVAVQAECPDVFTGIKDFNFDEISPVYARYTLGMMNTKGASEGEYEILVWAEDVLDASDPKHLIAYAIATVTVEPEVIIPDPPEVIIVIEDVFHSPHCAKVDTVTDKCYVNSTQLSPTFDVSIRSIDADENVDDFFMKSEMGGWFGLNPEVQKLVSPAFLTISGGLDYLDTGGGSHKYFFIPIDPVAGAAGFGDGEVFTTISKACTIDCLTDRLVIWDPTDSSPDYHEYSTGSFPMVMDGDYGNNRLFVYCLGNPPEVNVFNMVDETMIASFTPQNTTMPFWTEIDFDPDTGRLYIGVGSAPGSIEVWDMEAYEYIDTIETPLDEVCGIEHLGEYIYCTGKIGDGNGKLLMIDPELMYVIYELDCGENPGFLAANPNNKKIYVPDIGTQTVWVWQAY